MPTEFTVGFRTTERELDAMVPLSMSAEGVGAALYLMALVAGSRASGVLGLALVLFGAAALFAHLGHPLRSWRVVAEASRAWMSRGAVSTAGLIVLGALALLLGDEGVGPVAMHALALICAFVVILYTGILFSSIQAVPFWNTPLLPIVFLLHSLSSAGVLLLAVLSLGGAPLAVHSRDTGLIVALLLSTLGLTWELAQSANRSEAAQESVRLLATGRLRTLFRQRGLSLGLAAPLVLVTAAYLFRDSASVAAFLLLLAVPLRLAGDVTVRYAMLRAGVYSPLI